MNREAKACAVWSDSLGKFFINTANGLPALFLTSVDADLLALLCNSGAEGLDGARDWRAVRVTIRVYE